MNPENPQNNLPSNLPQNQKEEDYFKRDLDRRTEIKKKIRAKLAKKIKDDNSQKKEDKEPKEIKKDLPKTTPKKESNLILDAIREASLDNEPEGTEDGSLLPKEVEKNMEIIKEKDLKVGHSYSYKSPGLIIENVEIKDITEEGLIVIIDPEGEKWSLGPENFS